MEVRPGNRTELATRGKERQAQRAQVHEVRRSLKVLPAIQP